MPPTVAVRLPSKSPFALPEISLSLFFNFIPLQTFSNPGTLVAFVRELICSDVRKLSSAGTEVVEAERRMIFSGL